MAIKFVAFLLLVVLAPGTVLSRATIENNVKEDILNCLISVVVKLVTCLVGEREYEHGKLFEALKLKFDNKQLTTEEKNLLFSFVQPTTCDGECDNVEKNKGGKSKRSNAENATRVNADECLRKAGKAALACLFFGEDVFVNLNNHTKDNLDLETYVYENNVL